MIGAHILNIYRKTNIEQEKTKLGKLNVKI